MNYIRPEINAMRGYVPGEQPKAGEAVKLNTNENPYRASEKVYAAIRKVADEGLSRYPDPIADSFRKAAAQRYGVPQGCILCGNGSDDLLTILTRTFISSGEILRLPCPSYILYQSLAEIQGAKSETVFFNNDWSLPNSFCAASSAGTLKLAFLPNPNSPSGTVLPKERVLQIAEQLPCPLVVDEAYADFAEDNCISLLEQTDKIIICRTLSKSFSLAGLRFGFLFAAPKYVEAMLKVKDSYNCDSLSIAAAIAAIQDTDWQQDNRSKIIAARSVLVNRMRELGFTVPDSQANFTWNTRNDMPVKPIYEYLKQHGYLVRYMNYADWGDGLRISAGTPEQTSECLSLIEKAVLRTAR
ncbi:MAG: histidinol-phosphate transaminase [Planctomycetaceae bacterium]|nr:histidinol-phosphate transaminase [Planctomycetaceae bacterium]